MTHETRNQKPSSTEVLNVTLERVKALSAVAPADRDPDSWYYEAHHVGDLSVLALAAVDH